MDYNNYRLSGKEKMWFLLEVSAMTAMVSYLFYQSVWAVFLGLPIGLVWHRQKKKRLSGERKRRLSVQFRDAILAVSSALQVGYSIENAFAECEKDLKMTYPADADIIKEIHNMNSQIRNNVVLEKLLLDFAVRSHIGDIRDFAEVFVIAKRKGGDMSKIIHDTADIISEKIEVYQEIETILAAKQLEQRIMSIVPVMIMAYISLTSPHFFDSLYHNLFGICLMTICLGIYAAAICLGEKIIAIEI